MTNVFLRSKAGQTWVAGDDSIDAGDEFDSQTGLEVFAGQLGAGISVSEQTKTGNVSVSLEQKASQTLEQGTPMGLLLTITYPTTTSGGTPVTLKKKS